VGVATRKQRSRRAKTFRHEYALVTTDDEGNEVEVSSVELRGKKPEDGTKPAAKAPDGGGRASREPPAASWRRAVRRGGLMGAGLALIMVTLLKAPPVLGLVYGVLFIPLTYWMDHLTHRWWLKRQNAASSATTSRRKGR